MTPPDSRTPALTAEEVSRLRHDLRTPVNAVLGYSEMLLEDAPGRATALDGAVAAARRILAIIDATLSPAALNVVPSDLQTMRAAMAPLQQSILQAVGALRSGDDSLDTDALADLGRIEEAARRLLATEAPTVITETPTMIVAAPPPPPPAPETRTLRRHSHILVVDDVADNRNVLERRLQRDGHDVTCAGNGREALDLVRDRRFDLILLDILMPEVDGFEVLRQLKHDPDTRDIPVVMISALDDLESVVRCIEQGAEDHLTKPFDPVLLRARISASLEKKRLRDREREYLDEVKAIAAAASAVEDGQYDPASLSRTALRSDELGRLARVFDGMAAEVKAREDRLRREVTGLRQEIEQVRRLAVAADAGDMRLPVGHVLAHRYEILELVGVGAMGTVYRAADRDLTEDVALKVLRPELLSDTTVLKRFKAEVRLARRISHPAVVRTHDFGEADGVQYLTMEYVEGLTARELLDSRGRLGADSVLALARQLTEALVAAHAQGVIHRDIKPQNLLIDGAGALKVMDFGVSRLSGAAGGTAETGLLVGTPAYMAPEQLLGEDIDERADLYAVGVVLFECLTGQLPFVADTLMARMAKVLQEDAPPATAVQPDVPPALSALVSRLLTRARADRIGSSSDLLRLLNQLG